MKALLMAGGKGSRLAPLTLSVSKHLLPVFDKPMIYYSLSLIMLAGIREVGLVCTLRDQPAYEYLLGDGSELGIEVTYIIQESPGGIAEGLILGKEFLSGGAVFLVLGDNFMYGRGLTGNLLKLKESLMNSGGARIFAFPVSCPCDFGVVELDQFGSVRSVEEKPKDPKSNLAIPGLYMLDETAVDKVRLLDKSCRGEIEILDLLQHYFAEDMLAVSSVGRGMVWFDLGTFSNLLKASEFISMTQDRQGELICCLEEIAFQNGWISAWQAAQRLGRTASFAAQSKFQKWL